MQSAICMSLVLQNNVGQFNIESTYVNEAVNDNYRKNPKFWDARKHCCNLPIIQTKDAKS